MQTMTADDVTAFAFPQPERLRESSQRLVNFWVGVMSPAWAPFFAASSLGLGVWAMAQTVGKSEGLFSDLPMAAKWPGFAPWLNAALPEEGLAKAAEVVEQAAGSVAPMAEAVAELAETTAEQVPEAVETAATGLAAVVEPAPTLAETLWPQLEQPIDMEAEATKVLIDPVTEMPVVPEAVEAIAEPAPLAEPAPAKVEPRPIAKSLSAAKKRPTKS